MIMKRRPWPIIVLAVFHVIAPLGNFFFSAYNPNISYLTYFLALFDAPNIWTSICFLVLPVLAGVTIYLCKRWSIWAYLFLMSIVLMQSYIKVHPVNGAGLPIPPLMLILINMLVVVYFLVPTVRQIYFDPRLRWWESKPRYNVVYDAEIRYSNLTTSAAVKNISETGLFAIIKDAYPEDGASLEIHFKDGEQHYVVAGTAIHHMRQPKIGIGIKFSHTPESKKTLRFLTEKLEAEGKRISYRGGVTEEDSLLSWLKSLKKNPKNLFPNIEKK